MRLARLQLRLCLARPIALAAAAATTLTARAVVPAAGAAPAAVNPTAAALAATLTSAALAACPVAVTEPTTTAPAADLTTSNPTATTAIIPAIRPSRRHGELAGPVVERSAVGTGPTLPALHCCSGANVPSPSSPLARDVLTGVEKSRGARNANGLKSLLPSGRARWSCTMPAQT